MTFSPPTRKSACLQLVLRITLKLTIFLNNRYLPHWGDTVHKLVGNKVSDSEKPATSTETAATTSASDAKARSDDLFGDEALFGRGYVSSMFSKVYETLFEVRIFRFVC